MSDTADRVKKIVVEHLGVEADKVTEGASFIDDLGAVVIIAFFYTSGLSMPMLLASLATLAILIAMNRLGVRRLFPYLLVGGVLWFFVLQSGVHATLAGVAVALCIPMGKPEEEARSPLLFLEEKLHMGGMAHLWRVTPTECVPFLGKPVSSMIHQPPRLKSMCGTTH